MYNSKNGSSLHSTLISGRWMIKSTTARRWVNTKRSYPKTENKKKGKPKLEMDLKDVKFARFHYCPHFRKQYTDLREPELMKTVGY